MARRYITVQEQRFIIDRAKGRCEYCQSWMDYSAQPFTMEHVTPLVKTGVTRLDDMALSCDGCNGHKYTKIESFDPVSRELVPLYNPRTQMWHEHFSWSDDYLQILGLTAIGRATVDALQMNRIGLMNGRRLLRLAGQHPPAIDNFK